MKRCLKLVWLLGLLLCLPQANQAKPFKKRPVTVRHSNSTVGTSVVPPESEVASNGFRFRVAAYNIAHARGEERGGWREELAKMKNLRGIVDLLKREKADIIGLTEISRGDLRAGFRNQPKYIAKKLGFHHVYAENKEKWKGLLLTQGNALVSKFPIVSHKNHKLFKPAIANEQRACLDVVLDMGQDRKLRVMVCHLSTNGKEGARQMEELWELIEGSTLPVLLVGDFNARPHHDRTKQLSAHMQDTTGHVETTFRNKPGAKIDYHFLLGDLQFGKAWVCGVKEGYSDHGCLVNDYWWPGQAEPSR